MGEEVGGELSPVVVGILSVVLTAIIISTIFAIYYFYFRPKEGLKKSRVSKDPLAIRVDANHVLSNNSPYMMFNTNIKARNTLTEFDPKNMNEEERAEFFKIHYFTGFPKDVEKEHVQKKKEEEEEDEEEQTTDTNPKNKKVEYVMLESLRGDKAGFLIDENKTMSIQGSPGTKTVCKKTTLPKFVPTPKTEKYVPSDERFFRMEEGTGEKAEHYSFTSVKTGRTLIMGSCGYPVMKDISKGTSQQYMYTFEPIKEKK